MGVFFEESEALDDLTWHFMDNAPHVPGNDPEAMENASKFFAQNVHNAYETLTNGKEPGSPELSSALTAYTRDLVNWLGGSLPELDRRDQMLAAYVDGMALSDGTETGRIVCDELRLHIARRLRQLDKDDISAKFMLDKISDPDARAVAMQEVVGQER